MDDLDIQKQTIEKIRKIVPKKLQQKEDIFFAKFSKHKGNTQTKLKYLYEFSDTLFGYVYQAVPCKKGCSYCCHIPVSVSEVEVTYIEKSTGIKRKNLPEFDTQLSVPCPFLKKNVCSIYEYRPYFCRVFVSVNETAAGCYPDVINKQESLMFGYGELQKSYFFLVREMNIQDIREVFK